MLDKMLGVSPPPKGETPDSKTLLNKDFRGISKSDYKRDFDKALAQKLDHKRADLENKREIARKHEKSREEELRAERKEKKSLGGNKKKAAEHDDKMVLNATASKESKVETPEAEEQNPAKIELDITQKAQKDQEALAADAAAKAEDQSKMQSLEAELGAAVGFKSEAGLKPSGKDLAEKLKQEDGVQAAGKTSAFEQSVLDRLQKDMNPGLAGKNSGGPGQQGADSKDLKSELLDTNQLHQAAGQSHGDFKAHLAPAAAAPADSVSTGKLEENREANISEIMNRAQYLVKKGGGEMTVKMTPEGLGEVHLKVLLQDGKLNIEMQTHDKDVKKLIEDSLTELKSGLAAHRLSLEHVKVDTVHATNADNNTQFQSNLNQGGSQERSREFWSDFQGGMNQQQSRSRSAQAESVAPSSGSRAVPSASPASALRTYGGTKGASFNRVA